MLGLQAFSTMVGHYLLSLTKLTYSLYPLKQEQRSKCMFSIQSITFIPFKPQFVQKVKISHSSLIILSKNLVNLGISRFSYLYILHIANNFEKNIACNMVKIAEIHVCRCTSLIIILIMTLSNRQLSLNIIYFWNTNTHSDFCKITPWHITIYYHHKGPRVSRCWFSVTICSLQ